jgi:hypothetical protein
MKTWIKYESCITGLARINVVNQKGDITQLYLNENNGQVYTTGVNTVFELGYADVKKFVKAKKFKRCRK